MIVSANGIVFNEYGDVLLIQRDDTRTLAPPGGACEIDELPETAVAREVREETGLIVMAVRLVGLYYLPTRPIPYLFLCYRCIQRGGEITTSAESPQAGFFRTANLPIPMLAIHREQVERAFAHSGGPPHWRDFPASSSLRAGNFLLNNIVYPFLNLRRSISGQPTFVPPPDWTVSSTLVLHNSKGEILWLGNDDDMQWTLPATPASANVSPWAAAALLEESLQINPQLQDLQGVYLKKGHPQMNFVFTGTIDETGRTESLRQGSFFRPGQEPANLAPTQRTIAADVSTTNSRIVYKLLE